MGWKTNDLFVVVPATVRFLIIHPAIGMQLMTLKIAAALSFLEGALLSNRSIPSTPETINVNPAYLVRTAKATATEELTRSTVLGFSKYLARRKRPKKPSRMNVASDLAST